MRSKVYIPIIIASSFVFLCVICPQVANAQDVDQILEEYSLDNAQPETVLKLDSAQRPIPIARSQSIEFYKNNREVVEKQINKEILYVKLLCAVTVICLLIVLAFIKMTPQEANKSVVRASGLILITYGTIMLVIIIVDQRQLTAAMGILGAIAGYLFGYSDKPT